MENIHKRKFVLRSHMGCQSMLRAWNLLVNRMQCLLSLLLPQSFAPEIYCWFKKTVLLWLSLSSSFHNAVYLNSSWETICLHKSWAYSGWRRNQIEEGFLYPYQHMHKSSKSQWQAHSGVDRSIIASDSGCICKIQMCTIYIKL